VVTPPPIPLLPRIIALLVAAGCVAGVFAIHHIESAGSPVGAPALSRVFSPNGDGVKDTAVLRFTLRDPGHVDVWVTRPGSSRRVATVASNRRASGPTTVAWTGATDRGPIVARGRWQLHLRVRELDRTFPITRPVSVDVQRPEVSRIRLSPNRSASTKQITTATLSFSASADTVGRRVELHGVRVPIRRVERTRSGKQHSFTITLAFGTNFDVREVARDGVLIVTDAAGNATTRGISE
jgi:hypothetical protein